MPAVETSNAAERRLKADLFGEIWHCERGELVFTERRLASAPWATRWLARWLARREAAALRRCAAVPGTPPLLEASVDRLRRGWIDGQPMQLARPTDPHYFRDALRLVRRLHRAGVAHNDLAKEPNWLVTPAGRPALVDFQLASISRRRGRWFRTLAREDLRHLLKHKRTYCPEHLTARQRRLLARRAWPSRLWMLTGKPVYLLITRRLLGWADREGAGDRYADQSSTGRHRHR
ncbi:MAG: serine/threonine protein kinase [Pseudomonadota bacterium]